MAISRRHRSRQLQFGSQHESHPVELSSLRFKKLKFESLEERHLMAIDVADFDLSLFDAPGVQVQTETIEGQFGVAEPLTAQGPVSSEVPQLPAELSHHMDEMEEHDRPGIPEIEGGPVQVGDYPASAVDGAQSLEAPQAAADFTFFSNTIDRPASGNFSQVNEPSLGTLNNVVFQTGNWFASVSGNNGNSFSYVNPYTTFPEKWGGFCCDQRVAHDASRDILFWYLQYVKTGSGAGDTGGARIARATSETSVLNNSWIYYDFEPTDFNLGLGKWMDFPHMQVSDNFLYASSNVFTTTVNAMGNSTFTESVLWRIPLSELQAGGAINYIFWTRPAGTNGNFSLALANGASNTMYAASIDTSTSLRVYTQPENVTTLSNVIVSGLNTTFFGTHTALDNNGNNWTSRADSRAQTVWVSGNTLGLMWNSAQGTNRPLPFVRAALLNKDTKAVLGQPDLWSTDATWHYPAMAVNDRGHIAGPVSVALVNSAPRVHLLIDDDFAPDPAPWTNFFGAAGTDGATSWGDYLGAQPDDNFPNTWIAGGFVRNGTETQPRFFWFGRERDTPPVQDTTPPTVVSTAPADGSTLSSGPTEILVNFSEAMRQGAGDLIPGNLTLGGAGQGSIIVANAAWTDADTARFTFTGSWGTGPVTVQLPGTFPRDLAGNPLVPYTTGDFTITPVPIGDRFEPNNSFGAATSLGSLGDRTENDLSIHAASNDDYYRLTAAASGNLTVDLSFLHAAGDVDLFVYNASQSEIGRSDGTGNSESVTVAVTAGQTYYIKVIGFSGATNPDYDMVIDGPNITSGPPTVVSVGPVSPDPRSNAVSSVAVVMSEVINLSTFTFADLTLTRNGGANLINSSVTVTQLSDATYQINNLGPLTGALGTYVLTVNATEIQDLSGMAGTGTGSDTWQLVTSTSNLLPITDFAGIAFDGGRPPDPTAAAGPANLFAMVNRQVSLFSKTGVLLQTADLFAPSGGNMGFFESVDAGYGAFDPWVVYDRYSDRFIAMAEEVDFNGNQANLLIAISTSSSPDDLDTAPGDQDNDWHVFSIPATFDFGNGLAWADYPKISADADSIYITGNYFRFTDDVFQGARITRLAKTPMLSGTLGTRFDVTVPNAGSLQPIQGVGRSASDPHLFAEDNGTGIRIWELNDANVLTAATTVPAPYNFFSGGAPQPGTNIQLDTLSSRLINAVWRNNSLWTAHTVDVGGEATVRWYQISTTGGNYSLVQSGNIDPGTGIHTFMPAITVDGQGNMGITYTQSSSTQLATMMYTGRLSTAALGTVEAAIPLKVSTTAYMPTAGTDPVERWGDYAGISVDPSDDRTFWAFHEYAVSSIAWGTWWGAFRLLTGNNPPDARDDFPTVARNSQVNSINVTANDLIAPDVGETLSVVAVTQGAHGLVQISQQPGHVLYRPNLNYVGEDVFTYTINDGNGGTDTATVTVMIEAPATNTELIFTGPGAGQPQVRTFNVAGQMQTGFQPYPGFLGEVRVATGYINNDSTPDILTAVGSALGVGPHVKVFDGLTGAELFSFYAYGFGFNGGVYIAAGDVNGDGQDDIITGADAGAGPHVKVFSGATGAELFSFYAYGQSFNGGVRVAGGDVNGDGRDDIITGAGRGAGPHVKVFSGLNGSELASFYAYGQSFGGGVFVGSGDVNDDGRDDIVTGAGPSAGPHVKVFNGANLSELFSFYGFDQGFTGGVRVAAGDLNSDGRADIIVGAGPGAGPHVRAFNGVNLAEMASFYAYPANFPGGVFVAGINSSGSTPLDQPLEIQLIRQAAISRFADSGLASSDLDRLRDVRVSVADLPGNLLGLVRHGSVLIDRDAAGRGWFIDSTPLADEEFLLVQNDQTLVSHALDHVDLLSVVMHELADLLQHDPASDVSDALLFDDLGIGVRRLPRLVDAALANW